jgi:hypothetical protein
MGFIDLPATQLHFCTMQMTLLCITKAISPGAALGRKEVFWIGCVTDSIPQGGDGRLGCNLQHGRGAFRRCSAGSHRHVTVARLSQELSCIMKQPKSGVFCLRGARLGKEARLNLSVWSFCCPRVYFDRAARTEGIRQAEHLHTGMSESVYSFLCLQKDKACLEIHYVPPRSRRYWLEEGCHVT